MVGPPAGAPPRRQAFSLIRYSSVSLMSPCLMAWNTTSAVTSFIMLEGARNSSGFFSNSTLPLEASIRIAVGASPSKPPSSFLAPCTLLLAAYTTPPHPTAAATMAAIRLRHARPVAALELRESNISTAIGDALKPRVLTVGSVANNTGFRCRRDTRSDCGAGQTTLSCRPTVTQRRPETRRKRDAILPHHFRQRDRDLSAPTGRGSARCSLPRLAGI